MRTYFIRNFNNSPTNTRQAIESIERVIRALKLPIMIPVTGASQDGYGVMWESLIVRGANTVTATINIYQGDAPALKEEDYPGLTVSDRP